MTGFLVCLVIIILINIAERILCIKRDDLVIADLKQQLKEKTDLEKVSIACIQGLLKKMEADAVEIKVDGKLCIITVDRKRCCVEFTMYPHIWPEIPESQDGILN